MKTFYSRCLKLRTFYLSMETDDTKLVLLSKIVAISFYNESQLDDIPKREVIEIDCSDLSTSISVIENSLAKVLSDLEFKDFDIWHSKNYNLFHKVNFKIKS